MHEHDERLKLALAGFRSARDRVDQAITAVKADSPESGDASHAILIPVMEALWWARSVDEEFLKEYGPAYTSSRQANPNGRLMDGIRYARNRGGHQRAVAVVNRGWTLPLRLPFVIGTHPRWRRAEELPSADNPHHESGKDVYQNSMAGDPVAITLRHVNEWFTEAESTLRTSKP